MDTMLERSAGEVSPLQVALGVLTLEQAALLLRVSRLLRERADAHDEFRRAMIAAVGRAERAREAQK